MKEVTSKLGTMLCVLLLLLRKGNCKGSSESCESVRVKATAKHDKSQRIIYKFQRDI